MRRKFFLLGLTILLVGVAEFSLPTAGQMAAQQPPAAKPAGTVWSLDADYIEACSCHLFCPCYFNPTPEHPYCEFQMAVRVNSGRVGDVSLKGMKYWLTGDLGEDFGTTPRSPWLVVTFDSASTPAQRNALAEILPQLYKNFDKIEVDVTEISWAIGPTEARAKLANGKGEMVLEQWKGADGGKAVLHNAKYFNAKSNKGFVMYKSKVHRWEGFGHKFSYAGRNAFTIRIQASGTV